MSGTFVEIYPSILSADFGRLAEEIALVEAAGADGIHLDVMDGHFVPNLTFGPPVIKSIRPVSDLPFWSHLMIKEPGKYIEAFHAAGVQGITIHCEIETDWVALADAIHALGIEAGVAVNPDTPVERILDALPSFERVLIMTVHPGFGGQSFMSGPVDKIRAVKQHAETLSHQIIVAVDGGIDEHTAPMVVDAGADILIAGSAIFHADDPALALYQIRTAGIVAA